MGEDNLESGMDALYLFFQISSTVGAGTVYPSGRKAAAVVAAVACVCAMISLLSGAGHWLASRRARRFAEVQLQTCSYLVMCLTGGAGPFRRWCAMVPVERSDSACEAGCARLYWNPHHQVSLPCFWALRHAA